MGNGITILGVDAGVLFLLLLILIIILALITVTMSIRLTRLIKKYQLFMKGKDGATLEKAFSDKFEQVTRIARQSDLNKEELDSLKNQISAMFTHYGFVKYDAFNDVGGKMSFALAMLDDSNSGFILNTIHSRDNCFQYIKEIVNGESYIMLSKEEIEALNNAIDKKETDMLESL
jgi:hypothetical protein